MYSYPSKRKQGVVAALSILTMLATTNASPAPPQPVVSILPICDKITSLGGKDFGEADLQAEMTKLKTQVGQNGRTVRVGFSHIVGSAEGLKTHCRLAKANNLSVGTIIGIQTHSGGGLTNLALKDFRRFQWRMDGKTWEGESVVDKNGNPAFPARDWRVPTPSRYCDAIHNAAIESTLSTARNIKSAMDAYPGVIVAVDATIEEELATGGEKSDDLLADYSPYAITEFRDWLRHTGRYDDTSGVYAGQGAPEEIVGPFVRIRGALRSPFYDDPTPGDASGTGESFNQRFGTDFKVWALHSWDLDRFPDPITDRAFSPMPTSGKGFIEGGFDAPRKRDPANSWWRAWSWDVSDQKGAYPPGNPTHPAFGFRQFEVKHFVSDVLDEAVHAGVPAPILYSHQIAGEQVGPTRGRSGADPIWTGLYESSGTLGITRFGPIDPARLAQYSHNWGIFEWHPKYNVAPDDPALYDATLKALDLYTANGGRVFYAGWWLPGGKIEKTFPLNDSRFAAALHDWIAARETP